MDFQSLTRGMSHCPVPLPKHKDPHQPTGTEPGTLHLPPTYFQSQRQHPMDTTENAFGVSASVLSITCIHKARPRAGWLSCTGTVRYWGKWPRARPALPFILSQEAGLRGETGCVPGYRVLPYGIIRIRNTAISRILMNDLYFKDLQLFFTQ